MELLANLLYGFDVALSPANVLLCLAGVALGTLIGVLPGIGPLPAMAMLLPMTFYMQPVTAVIMLSGIYYGAQYGGSITAVLINLPGESSSVVTCIDGYAMAKQGRAGPALAIAAIGSFFAGTVTTVLIAIFAPTLAKVALTFGSPDYFSLMLMGLVGAVILAHGSMVKAIAMVCVGLVLGLVGGDIHSGVVRFDLGIPELSDRLSFVVLAIGLFGIAEVMANVEVKEGSRSLISPSGRFWPTAEDYRASWRPILRGTGLGSILGVLPGGGALLASFASYALEKRISKSPGRFGNGAIEGVAGPESANNAGAQASFIPMLTLGIPPNAIMALMVGALTLHGIAPGPRVMSEQPGLFWGLIASMWVGNLMLLVLNLPLVGLWIKLLKIPYRFLFPSILVFCCVAVFSIGKSQNDLMLAATFGLCGYLLVKLGFELAPLILGFVLGPLLEENFRRSMLVSGGDLAIFVKHPVSLAMLILTALLVATVVFPAVRKSRDEAFESEDA